MLASFNAKEFALYAINVGNYWRCLRRKVPESNLSSSAVWGMSCTEIREETGNKEGIGAA